MEEMEKRREELKNLVPKKYTEDLDKVAFPSAWKLSEAGVAAIKHGVAMSKTKHGMYASIPMLCRGQECAYADVCPMLQQGFDPTGERCPLEISLILTRFEDYKEEFGVQEEDFVDMSLIKDLIDYDIQLMRAENKMAIDGDFTEENVVGIDDSTGDPIVQKKISNAADYKDRIIVKRHKVLELMNSTRKDKAGSKLTIQMDPSTYASDLMKSIQNGAGSFVQGQVIDLEELDALIKEGEVVELSDDE